MVSEHMLTVGRDPRNWQAHRKDFSLLLHFQKDLLPLFSSELIQISPFSETKYPFPLFDHTKIRLMRPLQEVQDIGQLRPLRNEEYFPCIWIMETTTVEGRRQVEFEGSEEFPDLYDLGRLPLWNLADYGSCQYSRSRCIGERLKQGAW